MKVDPATPLIERIGAFIEANELIPAHARVIAGVSGGVDSVVLLHALHHLGFSVVVAHVNYQLRGKDADADETYVRELGAKLGTPVRVARFHTESYAREQGQSIQEAAREIRYRFYQTLATELDVQYVAVGHHLDDQVETVLLNLFRGSGPDGLAGMSPSRTLTPGNSVRVVRPLLGVRRTEIEAYARSVNLDWRTDVTNTSLKYRRSAIREIILPEIERHFGKAARDNIGRASDLIRAYLEHTMNPVRDLHWKASARELHDGGTLNLEYLKGLPPVWRKSLILHALDRWLPDAPRTSALAEEIELLLDAQPGRRLVLNQGTVWRDRKQLVFIRDREAREQPPLPLSVPLGETITIPGGKLKIELVEHRPAHLDEGAPLTMHVDADRLEFPLLLDRWKPGDRFLPLGMRHAKKVSDYLTDVKIPSHRRDDILVLRSRGEIVLILGQRLADNYRIRDDTRRIAKITYIPSSDA